MHRVWTPRLKRLHTLYRSPVVYFLTACTEARRPLLAQSDVHDTFVEYTRSAFDHGVIVSRYVLMPDHVHLFAGSGPGSPALSEWMKGLKAVVARHLKVQGVLGPYWQKGFFDHVMRSSESYEQKWLYVRENPVRAGMVRVWEEWPYQGEINCLRLQRRCQPAPQNDGIRAVAALSSPPHNNVEMTQ